MTLRESLKKALLLALRVAPDHSLALSTSTARGDYGRQKVLLHVKSGEDDATFQVLQSSRETVSAVEADVLAEATAYVHGQGGYVR